MNASTNAPVHFASIESVRDYAAGLSFQQLQCRDFGHNWRPHTAQRRDDGGFDRTLVCKCRAKRVQVLDSYGRIAGTHYEYPEGYQMPRGTGRISSDDKGVLRLASIEQDVKVREERAEARRTGGTSGTAKKSGSGRSRARKSR